MKRRWLGYFLIASAMFGLAVAVRAQGTPVAEPLWPNGAPGAQGSAAIDIPTLTAYLPAQNPTRTAVIIAPGGGYSALSMDKEGFVVAKWLNEHGVAAFVLKYRLGMKYHHPIELEDAQRAIRTVRARAAQYGLAPDHIGMCGFSAGGHLTATAGTLYDWTPKGNGPPAAHGDAIDKESARPDFLILAYPVITMTPQYAHKGSVRNLLGETPDPAQVDLLSPEKHVTAQTPPTFIYSTTDDGTVPIMNSVMFYEALVAAKVPVEMHLYQHGPHGSGLAQGFPDLKGWPDLLAAWMRARGWMEKQ